ncbi:MAG: glycosyltransferase WbuB [Planctomycetaceae bacterium]|nr:MAG: glycosyltransferase WbuB [Planctomycetaceae bacterium]
MRILLITNLFQPEPSHLKGLAYAKELQRRGHDVHVLTGFPNYPGGKLYPGYRMRWTMQETLDGVPVTRVAMYPSHDGSAIRRSLNYISIGISLAIHVLGMKRRFDVSHVCMGPITLMWPAQVLRRVQGTKVVADVQDIWPESVADSGMLKSGLALRILKMICLRAYRTADRIIVLSQGYKQLLSNRGIDPGRVDVVYNWCDESQPAAAATEDISSSILDANTFNVVYAGNLGKLQGPDTILDAAQSLAAKGCSARFVLIGGGVEFERICRRIQDERIANVILMPRMPLEQVNRILDRADLLLIHLIRSGLSSIAIPQKLQAYLSIGRPILLAAEGDVLDLFRQAGAGPACEPENPEAMAAAILRFMKLDVARREELGRRGQQFYRDALNFRKGVEHIERIHSQATEERKTPRTGEEEHRAAGECVGKS